MILIAAQTNRMKKIFIISFLVLTALFSKAQFPTTGPATGGVNQLSIIAGGSRSNIATLLTQYHDTLAANNGKTNFYGGSVFYSTSDGIVYYRDSANHVWRQLSVGGSGGNTIYTGNGSILTDRTINGNHKHLDIQGLSHYESYVSSLAGNNTLEIDSNFIDLFDGVHHNELLFNNNGISINSTKGWMVNGDYGIAGYVLTSNGSSPPTWNVLSSNQNFANTDLIQTADRYYNSHGFNNTIDSSRNFNIITQDFDDQGDGNSGFLSYNSDMTIYGQVNAFQGQALLRANNAPNSELSSFSANVTNPTQGSSTVFAIIKVDSGTRINNIFITPDTSTILPAYNFLTLINNTLYRVPLSTLGAGTVTSVAGHSPVSGAVTLSTLSNGFGILGTAYNGSANQQWLIDTSSTGLSTLVALNDSAGVLRALSNTKQIQLNGTGYVKQSGTSTSYVSSIPNADLAHSSITFNNSFGFNWNSGNLGVLGSSITGTIDTTKIQTVFAGFDTANTLRTLINTKGNGTVTSVATGYGLTGGIITNTGTLIVDSATLSNYYLRRKDSLVYQPKLTAGTNITISNDVISASGGGSTLYAGIGLKKSKDSSNLYTDSLVVPQILDLFNMPQIKTYVATQGTAASSTVTSYGFGSLDSIQYYFTTTGGGTGTENGGVLVNSTSGDSIQMQTPIGVMIGNSIIAGHPWRNSGLETNKLFGYTDSIGQMEYYLDSLTNFEWKNRGWGGQTTVQIRNRFMRDAIGLSANPNDGVGAMTLSHKPSIVVIEGGVNDIFNGIPLATTEANLAWMAEICAEYQIPCIILNCVGQGNGVANKTQLNQIFELNKWFASGILNQYGCTVIDINSMWNSGTYGGLSSYGNDNVHYSSLVYSGDGIHFTQAGYRAVALAIFQQAKIPVCTKAVFVTALNPVTPIANYNRPTGITMNTIPYTLPNNAFDTISVTSQIKDSMWIKVTSSANVVGSSTQSGFSSIYFYLDNNPSNQLWYTRRASFAGSIIGNQSASTITITPISAIGTYNPFVINPNPGVGVSNGTAFNTISTAAGTSYILNDFNNGGILNAAALTVRNGGIATTGSYFTTNINSQIGTLQIGNNSTPSTTGWGLGQYNNAIQIGSHASVSSQANVNQLTLSPWTGSTVSYSSISGLLGGHFAIKSGWGNINTDNDSLFNILLNPTINDTVRNHGANLIGGIYFAPALSNQGTTPILSFGNTIGDELFNVTSGKMGIGTSLPDGSAKLDVSATKQAFLPPRMTTAQRDSIGYVYISSFSAGSGYINPPYVSISGGVGTGAMVNVSIPASTLIFNIANAGIGYKVGSTPPTVTLTSSGTGTGASVTLAIKGASRGDIIYNTTVDSMQYYNGSAWIDMGISSTAGATPTIAVGAGGGSGATATLAGNNTDGIITITTGTLPTLSAVVATITLGGSQAFTTSATMTLTPNNSNAAILSGASMVYVTGTTTTTVINSGSTPLSAATTYTYIYHLGGY